MFPRGMIFVPSERPGRMPYLQPDEVLSRFSSFARNDVRDAIPEEAFARGQVGSMASTLQFISGELAGMEPALDEQERTLREALADVEASLDDDAVATAVEGARTRLDDAPEPNTPERLRRREEAMLEGCEAVLSAVDDCESGRARELREPLYAFLDSRVAAQLRLLGREESDE